MLNVTIKSLMLSFIMLSVIMLSVIMLTVIMLSDIMLSVIMLSVIMLNVVVPWERAFHKLSWYLEKVPFCIKLYRLYLDIPDLKQ